MSDVAAPALMRKFPATVTGPGKNLTPVRVVVTREGMYVYAMVNRKPTTILAIQPQAGMRHVGGVWTVRDSSGDEWTIRDAAGCGCGNPLRRMPATPPKFLNVEDPATVIV